MNVCTRLARPIKLLTEADSQLQSKLSPAKKVEIVLSIIMGELTVQDVCKKYSVSQEEVDEWIAEATSNYDPRQGVLQKLRKFKRRVRLHVLPGGSLACIRFEETGRPLGDKRDLWCLPIPSYEPFRGEVILNFCRRRLKLTEIDIAFSNHSLPSVYLADEDVENEFELDIECEFRDRGRNTATIRLAVLEKEFPVRFDRYHSYSYTLPPPLDGGIRLGVGPDALLYYIAIEQAAYCLPNHFLCIPGEIQKD